MLISINNEWYWLPAPLYLTLHLYRCWERRKEDITLFWLITITSRCGSHGEWHNIIILLCQVEMLLAWHSLPTYVFSRFWILFTVRFLYLQKIHAVLLAGGPEFIIGAAILQHQTISQTFCSVSPPQTFYLCDWSDHCRPSCPQVCFGCRYHPEQSGWLNQLLFVYLFHLQRLNALTVLPYTIFCCLLLLLFNP